MEIRKLLVGVDVPAVDLDKVQSAFPDLQIATAYGAKYEAALPDADVILHWELSDQQLEKAVRLKWFQCVAAGVDRLPLHAMEERGIVVTNGSGIHAENISEHLLAMMLAFGRRLPLLIRAQDRHDWAHDEGRLGLFEIAGQHAVVLGTGDIGAAFGRKARALGMRVTGVSRSGKPVDGFDVVVPVDQLGNVIGAADHLVITTPLTPETTNLISRQMIETMKPGAYLHNIARGQIVDQQAMIDALQSGHLAGAGLDVTDPEPLPADSPLWDLQNVIITSHTSGSTPYMWSRLMDILIANCQRLRAGQEPTTPVSAARGY